MLTFALLVAFIAALFIELRRKPGLWPTNAGVVSLSVNAFDDMLKNIFTRDTIENLVYPKNVALAAIPKNEKFVGDSKKIPVGYANPQGRSATFTNAQGNQTNAQYAAFMLTRVRDYQLANIDNETIQASASDEGAFMEAATDTIAKALQNLSRSLGVSMYLDGTGNIGTVTGTPTATTFTLATNEDITRFEIGQTLVAGINGSTSSFRAGTMIVTSVNRISAVVTCSANVVAALVANDIIFVQGDAPNASSGLFNAWNNNLRVAGFAAWLPFPLNGTDPITGADSFFGQNRSYDRTRLGGVYYDMSGEPIEEGLIDMNELIAREGGSSTVCFMSFKRWAELKKAQGSKVILSELEVPTSEGRLGFKAIEFTTGSGDVKIVADVNCPSNYCYMLDMDTWKLESLGAAPDLLTYMDGFKAFRNPSQDSVELRAGYYGNVSSRAPGWSGVGYFGTL